MKNKEYIMPTVVLVCITLIITVILAFTYSVTSPVIAKINKETADKARATVLKDADSFSEQKVDNSLSKDGSIAEVYTADNGAGTVITALDSGFGGEITVMVGMDADGKITGVTVLNHSETPGLGTKAMTEEYLSQYQKGAGVILSKDGAANGDVVAIDTITGATVTSTAVFRAVEKALAYNEAVGGGSK